MSFPLAHTDTARPSARANVQDSHGAETKGGAACVSLDSCLNDGLQLRPRLAD